MARIDILSSLLEELEKEENEAVEAIMSRLKIRSRSGRTMPLRKNYDPQGASALTVNLRLLAEEDEEQQPPAEMTEDADETDDEEAMMTAGHVVHLTDQGAPYPAAFSRPVAEGEHLPHQKDELRPEDLVEHEQEPPEILVTEEDKIYVSTDLLEELIAREKDEKEMLYSPSPHAEEHHRRFHREMKKKIEKKR